MNSSATDEFAVTNGLLARRAFGRATRQRLEPGYEKIPQELSARLLQRLTSLAINPSVVLDIGTPLGQRRLDIRRAYPNAMLLQAAWHEHQFSAPAATATTATAASTTASTANSGNKAADLSAETLAAAWRRASKNVGTGIGRLVSSKTRANNNYQFSADPGQLPLADASVELVIACQVLPWCGDPGVLFKEVHRVLKPGGAFFWSSAGPDTLAEYRQLWSTIDTYPHVFGLKDMHDLGDDMLRSGFDSPVMDRENLNINYADLASLQSDLRAAGAVNLASGRRKGLMASRLPQKLACQCEAGLSVTIEHIQGHGWKKTDSQALNQREKGNAGSTEVRIPLSAVGRHRPGED